MKQILPCLFALLFASLPVRVDANWTIHEWGTFTSLQDESGNAIGGINTDDEPVPPFVHRLSHFLVLSPTEVPSIFFQGAPACHPDVTLRLETPVIYFHPPEGAQKTYTAGVSVGFRGGWLTEFYPHAQPDVPGLTNGAFNFGRLHPETRSALAWNQLRIGGDWPLTNTTARVWTSPRAVNAASVQSANGESEKFLFYRGVGHIDPPLRISRESGSLLFRGQLGDLPGDQPLRLSALWLVDIQSDGRIAFRSLPPFAIERNSRKILARTPASFEPSDFSAGNLPKLKAALHRTLVAEGLFADEAHALLNTWELSYFKSPGLRLFFIVPPAWIDHYLPLEISLPANINRVMVGRIELVTPGQRSRLRQIAHFPRATIHAEAALLGSNYMAGITAALPRKGGQEWTEVQTGAKPLASFVSVPPTYQTYLDLGRFRNALILDELKHRPTAALTNFISAYRLQPAFHRELPFRSE